MDILSLRIITELLFFDDDDEEEKLILVKVSNFAEEVVPNFADHQFQLHLRMRPETFAILLGRLQQLPNAAAKLSGNPELSLEKQLMIAIWYLANIESFRSVADRFGISKSTAWSSVYKICNLLLEANIVYEIISFPNNDRCVETINNIEGKTGFPGVIGAVDGSHVLIIAPKYEHVSYINRKGFHSVVLQGTCDSKKRFIHCYAGEVGSVHDACVFRRSGLNQLIMNIAEDRHLLGDSAYPFRNNLLVPFKDNGHLTNVQKHYNKIHSKSRVIIEMAFALLKGLRRLKLCETQKPELICLIIMSACILHNMCLDHEDVPNDINIEGELNEERLMNINVAIAGDEERNHVMKRDNIANALYLENLRGNV